MPVLEYAGGVRFYYCWYQNTVGVTRTFNSAFPELLRVGPNGVYIYYCYYLQTMNNAFPLLTTIDTYLYIYYNYYQLSSMTNSFRRLQYVGQYLYVWHPHSCYLTLHRVLYSPLHPHKHTRTHTHTPSLLPPPSLTPTPIFTPTPPLAFFSKLVVTRTTTGTGSRQVKPSTFRARSTSCSTSEATCKYCPHCDCSLLLPLRGRRLARVTRALAK